jgi:hypothetical protein
LDDFTPDWADVLSVHVEDLTRFVEDADGTSGWGIARFFNSIDQDHHDLVGRALAAVDPARFARKIEQAPLATLAGFAELLDRIAYIGRDGFTSSVRSIWSAEKIREVAKGAAAADTFAFGKFVDGLNHIDTDLSFQLLNENADTLVVPA